MEYIFTGDNENKLSEFVLEHRKNDSCNKYRLTYNISDKDGNVLKSVDKDVRLGITSGNFVIVMARKSARRGYYIDHMLSEIRYSKDFRELECNSVALVQVRWLKPVPRKSDEQKFFDKIATIEKYLQRYDLWENIQLQIKMMRIVGYDLCNKLKEYRYGFREPVSKEELEELKENYFKVATRVQLLGDKELIDYFEKTVVNHIYKDETTGLDVYPLVRCVDEFTTLKENKVKKMRFHKDSWCKSTTAWTIQRIQEHMEKRERFTTSGDNGYDVSFEYNAETKRAWYSEEFRGCGNGHYYIALDHEHALFCEDD